MLSANRKSGMGTGSVGPNDLERFLYGNAALNFSSEESAFVSASDVNKSTDKNLTDWEEMKEQLKMDQKVITGRVSRRKSQKDQDDNGTIGGLDPTDHFYFKPNASRKEAESSLAGCPEGEFYYIDFRPEGAVR